MVKTQLIRKVLSPAVRLWLRSQVDSAASLDFALEGSDRQLLSGIVPKVSVAGGEVVYKGLCLSQLEITGEGIHINLKQVLRGKPVQLLEPIFVQATLRMADTDMNRCLESPLLAKALSELLDQWLEPLAASFSVEPNPGTNPAPDTEGNNPQSLSQSPPEAIASHWRDIKIQFQPDHFQLWATLTQTQGDPLTVIMGANLRLQDPHTIMLEQLQWQTNDPAATAALESLDHLTLDLGRDVAFGTLQLEEGQLLCQGDLLVRP